MMRGWFGRTEKVALADEDEGSRPKNSAGGFGSITSFTDTDPPRSGAGTSSNEAPKSKTSFLSDSDSSSGSGGDDDDEESAEIYRLDDDYSVDQSTIAGPLFDESAYSVNEDEYSIDTFDHSRQEGLWRKKKANDFLADFYADREEKKKQKQAARKEFIASKNKSNADAAKKGRADTSDKEPMHSSSDVFNSDHQNADWLDSAGSSICVDEDHSVVIDGLPAEHYAEKSSNVEGETQFDVNERETPLEDGEEVDDDYSAAEEARLQDDSSAGSQTYSEQSREIEECSEADSNQLPDEESEGPDNEEYPEDSASISGDLSNGEQVEQPNSVDGGSNSEYESDDANESRNGDAIDQSTDAENDESVQSSAGSTGGGSAAEDAFLQDDEGNSENDVQDTSVKRADSDLCDTSSLQDAFSENLDDEGDSIFIGDESVQNGGQESVGGRHTEDDPSISFPDQTKDEKGSGIDGEEPEENPKSSWGLSLFSGKKGNRDTESATKEQEDAVVQAEDVSEKAQPKKAFGFSLFTRSYSSGESERSDTDQQENKKRTSEHKEEDFDGDEEPPWSNRSNNEKRLQNSVSTSSDVESIGDSRKEADGEDVLFGYGTDDSNSNNDENLSVSSDFRENELSKAMQLLNGDSDNESVSTEIESKGPLRASDAQEEERSTDNDFLADERTEAESTAADGTDRIEPSAPDSLGALGKEGNPNDFSENSDSSDDSEDNSDSDSDDDSDDEDGPKKLVVKEAPLLRLENVTAQTRSTIPESRMQKKGSTWSGWLFGAKDKSGSSKNGSVDTGDDASIKICPSVQSEEASINLCTPSVQSEDASINLCPTVQSEDTSTNLSSVAQTEDSVESSVLSKESEKAEKKKRRKEKKKEKKENKLAMHFNKNKVRKFTRHGDEVSVGTMNLKGKLSEEQQHVVISRTANLYDDNLDFSKEERPWDQDSSKKVLKLKKSVLNADKAIVEDPSEGSEEAEDFLEGSGMLDSLNQENDSSSYDNIDESEELSTGGDLIDPDGLSQDDAISLSALESTLQKNEEQEIDFDDMWETMSADVSTAMAYERKQRENFRKKKEKKTSRRHDEQDGDDIKRLRLFEKYSDKDAKKGKKGKGRRKKEKLSMEFLSAIREVFDEDDEGDSEDDDSASFGSKEGGSRVGRTRDDEDDDDDDDACDVNDEKSEMSMFIGTQHNLSNKRKGDTEELGSAGSDAEPSLVDSDEDASFADDKKSHDEDDASEAKSRASRRSKSTKKSARSKRTSKTSRSSSSKSTKVKRKPAEVLQEELKRQQGNKPMSVSTLKQEMSDRRGTSVELLKREFEKQKREKAANETAGGGNGVSGFGGFSSDFGSRNAFGGGNGKFGDSSDPFGGGGFDTNFSETAKGNEEPNELVSRWTTNDGITELDDLLTVQQEDAPVGGGGGTFGFGPPSTIIQNISSAPSMPEMPSLPTDLLSSPKKGKGKKSAKKKQDPFEANFDDMPMPLTTITEFDEEDDNEMGLLASSSQQDDDDMSHKSSRSRNRGGGLFKVSLKAPKLKGIGKLMPRRKAEGKKSSSGFFDNGGDDYDMASGGLLG